MKRVSVLCFTIIILQLSFLDSRAQNTRSGFKPYAELNIAVGFGLFWGDLQTYQFYEVDKYKNLIRGNGALSFKWQFTPVIGLRGQAIYGQIAGERKDLNRSFEAGFLEANACATIDIINLFKYKEKRFLSVYGFIGLGVTNYKSKLMELNTGSVIHKQGYDGDFNLVGSKIIGTVPAGLGLDFRLSNKLSINLETSWHPINTDWFDNKKGGFDYDIYSITSLGLTYKFRKKQKDISDKPKTVAEPVKEEEPEEQQKEPETETEDPYQPLIKQEDLQQETDQEQQELTEVHEPMEEPVTEVIEEEKVVVEEVIAIPDFYYSVQLIAKQEGVLNIPLFRNRHQFNGEIVHHLHEGYNIYTSGQFNTYEEARSYRDRIRSDNGITDAFVVAFENGKRFNKLP